MVLERLRLDGKVALVTGAGRGLGRAMALALAGAGADLACVARTRAEIESAAQEVRSHGRRAAAIVADVSDPAQAVAMVERTLVELGRLDVLINNAGGGEVPLTKMTLDLTDDDWRRSLQVNLSSVFYCSQAALRPMLLQGGGGVIINVSSSLALRGDREAPGYAAAKAGVVSFTQDLAMTFASHNIRANVIVPGYTASSGARLAEPEEVRQARGRFVPLGRISYAQDLGPLAVFLASEAASYITGTVFVVDGGNYAGGLAPVGWVPAVEVE